MNRMTAGFALLTSVSMLCDVAADDQDSIYESLPEVTIGRVFTTPLERARLERVAPTKHVPDKAPDAHATPRRENGHRAAGVIVRDGGARQIYKDGDFVPATTAPVTFPGRVEVRQIDTDDSADDVEAPQQ